MEKKYTTIIRKSKLEYVAVCLELLKETILHNGNQSAS